MRLGKAAAFKMPAESAVPDAADVLHLAVYAPHMSLPLICSLLLLFLSCNF